MMMLYERNRKPRTTITVEETVIKSREDAMEHLKIVFKPLDKNREHMIIMGLNASNVLVYSEVVAIGGMNRAMFEPRDIFRNLITKGCYGCIMAHNHPSNTTIVSAGDIKATKRVEEGCKCIGVELIDSIVFPSDTKGYDGVKK